MYYAYMNIEFNSYVQSLNKHNIIFYIQLNALNKMAKHFKKTPETVVCF